MATLPVKDRLTTKVKEHLIAANFLDCSVKFVDNHKYVITYSIEVPSIIEGNTETLHLIELNAILATFPEHLEIVKVMIDVSDIDENDIYVASVSAFFRRKF